MWSSSIDDCSTFLHPVCDYSIHGSDTTPPWEEVDGGWPHSGTLLHQERWGEWVLFWLQRALYVQYKLIGPPYFLEWNGVPLYSTKQTDYQRLSLCQLRMEPSVVLACLLVISTALETGLLNLSANFCPVICRCTASTPIFAFPVSTYMTFILCQIVVSGVARKKVLVGHRLPKAACCWRRPSKGVCGHAFPERKNM